MADFLTEKLSEMDRRLEELRPLHDEYLRLGAPGPRSRTSTPPLPARARGRGAADGRGGAIPQAPGGRRRRRRQGGTRAEQALQVVRQNPGITVSELAGRLGIAQANYLYRVMNGLQADGAVRREGRVRGRLSGVTRPFPRSRRRPPRRCPRPRVVTGRLHVIGHRLGLTEHGRDRALHPVGGVALAEVAEHHHAREHEWEGLTLFWPRTSARSRGSPRTPRTPRGRRGAGCACCPRSGRRTPRPHRDRRDGHADVLAQLGALPLVDEVA